MPPANISLEDWILKIQKLLKLEYEEEMEQERMLYERHSLKELEANGYAIRKLNFISQRSSLGKFIVKFGLNSMSKDGNLTTMGITKGDIVSLSVQNDTKSVITGTVLQVKQIWIEVAFNDDLDFSFLKDNDCFNIIKIKNDITYRRLKYCVDNLYKHSTKTYLIGLLFGIRPLLEPLNVLPPYTVDSIVQPVDEEQPIVWFNDRLNFSQKEAIIFALHQRHLSVIHGPPGTGKTTTLTELILQLITRGFKLLVCAHANVAVDNIFKQLLSASHYLSSKFKLKKPFSFIRLGNPARADPYIQPYTLDAAVYCEKSSIISELECELDQAKSDAHRNFSKIKMIKKDLIKYRAKMFEETLKGADVIFSTLTSSTLNGQLKYLINGNSGDSFQFDVVIVDEAAQAMEAAAWIPLAHAKTCILAGDHQQLPMTIVSQEAANQGLGISLIERALNLFADCPEKVVRMLTVQYRMNQLIMDWSSEYFYDHMLIADDLVMDRRLLSKQTNDSLPVIRLIDTTGCDMFEVELDDQSLSKGNTYEADIVCLYIQTLLDDGVEPAEIGVITPYQLQCCMIRVRCQQLFSDSVFTKLEINSVDAFQGREKEIIILSLVRSNPLAEIGFLEEKRRLNVAITRARSHLVVVCDSGTVANNNDALQSFIDYCYQHADVVTASDYMAQLQQLDQLNIETGGMSGAKVTKVDKNKRANKAKPNKGKGTKAKNPPKASTEVCTVNLEQIIDKLKDFQQSTCDELRFPFTLNNADRRLIHEQCEVFGLKHESVGVDPQRQLVVRR